MISSGHRAFLQIRAWWAKHQDEPNLIRPYVALQPDCKRLVTPQDLTMGILGELLAEHQRILDELAGAKDRLADASYTARELQSANASLRLLLERITNLGAVLPHASDAANEAMRLAQQGLKAFPEVKGVPSAQL